MITPTTDEELKALYNQAVQQTIKRWENKVNSEGHNDACGFCLLLDVINTQLGSDNSFTCMQGCYLMHKTSSIFGCTSTYAAYVNNRSKENAQAVLNEITSVKDCADDFILFYRRLERIQQDEDNDPILQAQLKAERSNDETQTS